ncbi:MAG TPA: alkaline phosphatase family protein [Streptosporangiaceae bacterium]|nr:alkaline phosphatase family protein [Streptosporangiaceae bacterium]
MTSRTLGRVSIAAAATLAAAALALPVGTALAAGGVHRFDHVVIVIMENKNYNAIIGRPDEAPYINNTLAKGGAVFSNSFAVTHPSQPNYLALFSGSTQRVTNDNCPKNFKNVANLGAELIRAGLSFTGYAETMPSDGYTGCDYPVPLIGYTRSHNPWVDFSNVPPASNRTFARFPKDYARLPTVSIVVPNECHDMHSCPRDNGDRWIQANLGGYASWARSNNSLLIVTWDEDGTRFEIPLLGGGDSNKVPTIFYGAHVRAGTHGERITHYSILRTLEDMYGLPRAGASASANPITDVWQ